MRSVLFDKIALMELTVRLAQADGEMVAKGAFVNSATGQTHGSTTGRSGWSQETVQALVRLRECIEADMERVHFADAVLPSDSPFRHQPERKGLGELLQQDDERPKS